MIEILFSNDRFGFNAFAVKKEQKKRTCYPCRSKKRQEEPLQKLGSIRRKVSITLRLKDIEEEFWL